MISSWISSLIIEIVKASFDEKTDHFFESKNKVKWKLFYEDISLYLSLLSGVASAEIYYDVRVEYSIILKITKSNQSSGRANIKSKESLNLNLNVKDHLQSNFVNTILELHIFQLNPFIEVPQQSTLSANLIFTLNSDEGFNDIKLYFGSEKEEIAASKFMLSARSPVFKTMFQSDMKEAKSKEVKIPDVSIAVGKEMITYIYTEQAPNIDTMTEELWFAAEKYQLSGLKALCENKLVVNLSVSNAAHCLLFADQYCGDGQFKDYVLAYITKSKNVCSSVMKSAEWQKVKKFPELLIAVTDKYFDIPADPASK